jgi:quercetin dioxygenase-like cupin family protein
MILLNESVVDLADRYFIQAKHITGTEKFSLSENNCTYFILSHQARLTSDVSGSGTFAAAVSGGLNNSITGDAVIITMYGVQRSTQSIATVDPSSVGDLSYIDGCSNSVLVGPPRNGDPCLNYLYFPEGIDQTFHTHPSFRLGIVASGRGYAQSPTYKHDLTVGAVFCMEEQEGHRFVTEDSGLIVISFHPDGDWGPTDHDHTLLNRTYLPAGNHAVNMPANQLT